MNTPPITPTILKRLIGISLLCVLVACGFKMRGQLALPFTTLYSNISKQSAFGNDLYRLLKASTPHLSISNTNDKAQVILQQLNFERTSSQVSLNAEGYVEEYELGVTFRFTLLDAKGRVLIAPTTINTTRLLPYDVNQSAAKSAEMLLLYDDMEKSIINRVYRLIVSENVINRYKTFNPPR